MLHILAKHWWVLLLRGFVSLAFAALAFFRPEPTFTALIYMLGAFILTDGLLAVYSGWKLRGQDEDWWVALLEGLLGVGLGVATLLKPEMSAALLITFVAIWCLVTGVFEIAIAIRIRKEIENEWMLALAGGVSILLGALILYQPQIGAISVVWWIGSYALFFGLLLVGLGLRLRRYSG